MLSVQEALNEIRSILSANPARYQRHRATSEAEWILFEAMRQCQPQLKSRLDLFTLGETLPLEVHRTTWRSMAQKRSQGYPLQYVLGCQYFMGHRYHISPGVFIPRTETETLVEIAIRALRPLCQDPCKGQQDSFFGAEIGIGSGNISIELLRAFSQLRMVGTDINLKACQLAALNVKAILQEEYKPISRLMILPTIPHEDFLTPLSVESKGRDRNYDFLISNPPYLSPTDAIADDVFKNEPHSALFPPHFDDVYFYQHIANHAGRILSHHAPVFLEIPHERASVIERLFIDQGWCVEISHDLTDRPRVLMARRLVVPITAGEK